MSDIHTVAARCIEDPTFARQVLEGDDYPEVRQAIVADAVNGAEVAGFFNPQPDPPGRSGELMKFDRIGDQWGQISLPQLNLLTQPQL